MKKFTCPIKLYTTDGMKHWAPKIFEYYKAGGNIGGFNCGTIEMDKDGVPLVKDVEVEVYATDFSSFASDTEIKAV